MTLSRKRYKNDAKSFLKNNYWICFIICFIVILISSLFDFEINYNSAEDFSNNPFIQAENGFRGKISLFGFSINNFNNIQAVTGFMVIFLLLVTFCINIFIVNPLMCSQKYFFLNNCKIEKQGNRKDLFFAFKTNYRNIVFVSFITDLIIGAGFLLLIIPGIIFSYMFRFVPYILTENPDISLSNALKKSKEMTDNIKIDLFVFDLSFILWYILASVINGLVFLFPFVKIPLGSCLLAPYTEQTFAFVYSDIRSKYTLY